MSALRVAVCALCVVMLPGCMLERLRLAQDQLCQRKTVRLDHASDISLVFGVPVLRVQDVVTLAGVKPVIRDQGESDRRTLEYRGTRKGDTNPERYSIPVVLEFHKHAATFLLERVTVTRHLKDLLSETLLSEVLHTGCTAELHGTTLVVNLKGVEAAQLPGRDAIEQILGRPHRLDGRRTVYTYAVNSARSAEITIVYDEKLETPSSARIVYFSYVLEFDFVRGQATGRMKNLQNALALSLSVAVSP